MYQENIFLAGTDNTLKRVNLFLAEKGATSGNVRTHIAHRLDRISAAHVADDDVTACDSTAQSTEYRRRDTGGGQRCRSRTPSGAGLDGHRARAAVATIILN